MDPERAPPSGPRTAGGAFREPEQARLEAIRAEDAPADFSGYGVEAWVALVFFWILSATVFYQFFTRYFLNDSASWTEEIARYLLVCVVFVGAAISVHKNTHIQVDLLYRFIPQGLARGLSLLVDAIRIAFFAYASFLTYSLIARIGSQQMTVIDWPIGLIYSVVLFAFLAMLVRAVQVVMRHWRQGYSVLERPESAEYPQ